MLVTVAQFNTHFGRRKGGRPFDVVAAIAGLDADVVALEEVWQAHGAESFAVRAGRELGYEVHEQAVAPGVVSRRRDVARTGEPAEGWWGLAVLTRVPAHALDPIPIGRAMGDRAPRVAMRVEVGPLLVVVTHVSHRLWGSPSQLRALARSVPADRGPAVVMGDFNMWGPVVTRIFGRQWRRAVRGRTWPAGRPHSQIDHVLVNDGVDVVESAVLPRTGSDHRPIRAVLRAQTLRV